MRCALNASESCTGDLLIACMEDLKTMPPSEIHFKIIKIGGHSKKETMGL